MQESLDPKRERRIVSESWPARLSVAGLTRIAHDDFKTRAFGGASVPPAGFRPHVCAAWFQTRNKLRKVSAALAAGVVDFPSHLPNSPLRFKTFQHSSHFMQAPVHRREDSVRLEHSLGIAPPGFHAR